jgi:hypothetical protein
MAHGDDDPRMRATYVRVLVLQAAFLLLLWAAGRYFGSP